MMMRDANPIVMEFHAIDTYLLDGKPTKAAAIEAALAAPVDDPRAAPFYRALGAVGARAADEALIALRLVLAGKDPEDTPIRRLRALAALARAANANDLRAIDATFAKDGEAIPDLLALKTDPGVLLGAAREAYAAGLT